MKIKKGDKIDEIILPKHDGSEFNFSDTKGKKVLLTFYRVAGCTFCNLRLLEFNRRYNEFGPNFTHVGIFHSNVSLLKSNMKKHGPTPFTILADENFKYFEKYEIERSFSKMLATILFKAHKVLKCRGVTRSDFKFHNGKFYLLETNTQPGMTNLSLVPEIALYHGMNFFSLIDWIIKDASKNR